MRNKCCITLVCLFAFIYNCSAQSYGVRFLSHEVVKEKRTALNLTPSGTLCFKDHTDISFDLSLIPNMETYFGYVFRLTMDHENIDLVYDQRMARFNCVIGEKLAGTFSIDSLILYNNWSTIGLRLSKSDHSAGFYLNDKLICSGKIKYSNCCRIFFGANDYDEFQTADIPPMNIKDIKISEEGKLTYYWPLDETSGNKSIDVKEKSVAQVTNAVWIKQQHQNWELNNAFSIKGYPSFAFNSKDNMLYVVSEDSIYYITISDMHLSTFALSEKHVRMPPGNQSVYDAANNKLHNFYIDQKKVSTFDFALKKWSANFDNCPLTEFWQANKFISNADTSLYILGGYGQLTYKNSVQRYNFSTGNWSTVSTRGDLFAPRYLSGLGTNAIGDTAYILGGYGSNTGNQVINPKHYYDLFAYDVKSATFKTIYTFKEPLNKFCFANSMIVDTETQSFYALIYPNGKFNSYLQLIQGSLNKPDYRLMGDSIPYSFYDVGSFSDLYFSSKYKKLIAVTLYTSKDSVSALKVYSIGFPPNSLTTTSLPEAQNPAYAYIIGGMTILGMGGLWVFYKRRKRNTAGSQTVPVAPEPVPVIPVAAEEYAETDILPEKKSQIHLFGQFEIFEKNGEDLTRMFTPLLKEMFLLIAIYTLKYRKGITSAKLYSVLWKDKSYKDARNNRSVNMVKLKTIIDRTGTINIVKEGDMWMLQYDQNDINIDFAEFINITEKENANTDIKKLLSILKRGSFLVGMEYEWLDDIKSDIANQTIDTLHKVATLHSSNFELCIEIANSIFFFDPVNEEALHLKCRSLNLLGRHSLAQSTYNKFLKDYHQMYGEHYKESLSDVIS